MTKPLLFLVCAFLVHYVQASRVSGFIRSEEGTPLGYATIYVQSLGKGTTANGEGYYFMDLPAGSHELIFRFIGYQPVTKEVQVADVPVELDITMRAEAIALREVTIKSRRGKYDDPAYAMIREAQAKRPYYLRQIKGFSCDAYVKGLQRMVNVPKKFMGIDITIPGLDSTNSGILYLSESMSRYHFMQPDREKEIMSSSKVSGKSSNFSWNSARDFNVHLYESLIQIDELSNRGFISPIAPNSIFYYVFEWLGTHEERGARIHKIALQPRRATDPCFKGVIYLQDSTWRIHAASVYLGKSAGINFVDSVHIDQVYVPVNDTSWLPGTTKFHFAFKFLKFQGNGYFMGSFSNYELNPVFPVGFFDGEVQKIDEDANTKDSTYWDSVRPVGLTEEEKSDYHRKDSLSVIWESREYKDSIDRIQNRLKPINILTGYRYGRSFTNEIYTLGSPLNNIQFNTVEGVVVNLEVGYRKFYKESRKLFYWENDLRYGFSSNQPYWQTRVYYRFDPMKFAYVNFTGGRYIFQFNGADPISPLNNTVYSLLLTENYMKLYEKTYVKVNYGRELFNGFSFVATLGWEERNALVNKSGFRAIETEDKEYTVNNPSEVVEAFEGEAPFFGTNQALLVGAVFRFRPGQKYIIRPNHKINVEAKYPEFSLSYRKAVSDIFGTDIDYDFLRFGIDHDLNLGLFGTTKIEMASGMFVSRGSVNFVDYVHFTGNQTIFGHQDLRGFNLLPYYSFSTEKPYMEGHLEHHFKGFIMNKIPILKKLRWQTVASAHVLIGEDAGEYSEIALGMENVFRVIRVDYAISVGSKLPVANGVRIRFGF